MDTNKFTSTNIPVTFQKMNSYDTRFMSVRIWLLHLGENYNGSYFTKQAVEQAIPTLANTPILGFVTENQIGKEDFAGHEMEVEIQNGDYVQKYLGQAFGVIPETNNPTWQKRAGDDGVEREYLVVEGLLWNKLQDGSNIMERDEVKGQSMELHTDYTGHFNKEGLFVFDKFSFYGACILGDSTSPAMQRSTIEKIFSKKNVKMEEEISNKLQEFRTLFVKEEGKLDHKAIMEEFGVTEAQLAELGIKPEDFSVEDFKEEIKRIKAEEEAKQKDQQDNPEDKKDHQKDQQNDQQNGDNLDQGDGGNDQSQDKKNDQQSTEKSNGDLGEGYKKSDEQKDEKTDQTDNNQSSEKTSVSDLEKQVDDLKDQLKGLQKDYSSLKQERDQLMTFKENKEKEDHEAQAEALFAQFDKLDETDYKDIRENIFDYTVEQIEDMLFSRLGRKTATFAPKKKQEFTKVQVLDKDKNKASGKSYDYLFNKHLKK